MMVTSDSLPAPVSSPGPSSSAGFGGVSVGAAGNIFAASANKLGSYIRLDPQTWDNVRQEGQRRIEALRPWSEFFDLARFSRPENFKVFNDRLVFNLRFFQNNYILIALVVVAYFLITQPWLLLSTAFLIIGFKYITSLPTNEPTQIGSAKFTQMQLWVMYGIISFVLLFFTGVSTALFWVATVCGAVICTHAGMIDKPVEAEFDRA